MTISAANAKATGATGVYTVSTSTPMYDRAKDTAEQMDSVFHTPASIGSSDTGPINNANDVACGVFASILEKEEDLNTFSSRIVQQGRPDSYIIQEALYTRELLNKLAMMQGVPIKDLLADMYPAMCSHIKA